MDFCALCLDFVANFPGVFNSFDASLSRQIGCFRSDVFRPRLGGGISYPIFSEATPLMALAGEIVDEIVPLAGDQEISVLAKCPLAHVEEVFLDDRGGLPPPSPDGGIYGAFLKQSLLGCGLRHAPWPSME